MKTFVLFLSTLTAILAGASAHAYPVIDEAVPVGGQPIAVYHDYTNPSVYWYIPQSIEPWKRDNKYRSSFFSDSRKLSFVFRGQASVEDSMLDTVAKSLGTKRANLVPIAYDTSSNFVCQDFFMEQDHVLWKFPSMIGNYLEVVPVSIRTENASVIDELKYHLTTGGGLACTVEVTFKAVSTAYRLRVTGNYNKVYERFEAAAHGEGLWWEVDLHTMLETLRQDHVIEITSLEDVSLPQSELDKKIQAAADDILKSITSSMFTPALKLPTGEIAGRGKAWSLRADYQRSEENNHVDFTLNSNKVQSKSSQISLRLSVD
jgi:hypothetical protein